MIDKKDNTTTRMNINNDDERSTTKIKTGPVVFDGEGINNDTKETTANVSRNDDDKDNYHKKMKYNK